MKQLIVETLLNRRITKFKNRKEKLPSRIVNPQAELNFPVLLWQNKDQRKMLKPRFLLVAIVACQFTYDVSAMDCNFNGIVFSCPTLLDKSDAVFCCQSSLGSKLEGCCNAADYLKQNTGTLIGILVSVLVLIVIITVCCCCFCSCCCLANRRVHQGRVLYGPLTSDQTEISTISSPAFSPYSLVQAPPMTSGNQHPPPYQPPPYPNFNNAYPPAYPNNKP